MRRPLCLLGEWNDEFTVPGVDRHTRSCLRCQAQRARNRRLARELRSLRSVHVPAPPRVAMVVQNRIGPEPSRLRSPAGALKRRLAAGGAVVATAAGAVLVLLRRLGHEVV